MQNGHEIEDLMIMNCYAKMAIVQTLIIGKDVILEKSQQMQLLQEVSNIISFGGGWVSMLFKDPPELS